MLKRIETKLFRQDSTQIVWDNIPRFAILSGINGAGKTRLLEKIQKKVHALDGVTQVEWIGQKPATREVLYIPVNHNFDDLTSASQKASTTESLARALTEEIFNIRDNDAEQNKRPAIKEIINKLQERTGRPILEITREEMAIEMPADALASYRADKNNSHIARAIEYYGKQEIAFRANFPEKYGHVPSREEIQNAIGESPREAINNLFSEFDFHLILPPYRQNQQYIVEFIDTESGRTLSFDSLSTGEKILVNVVLWSSSDHLQQHTKLFVFDELDAHLHPAIAKVLMQALKSHVVKKCGIQVIMSTHSPTTVAYADDYSVFRISRDRTITIADKAELIRELTDNFIAISKKEIPLLMDLGHVGSENFALFVEGPSDYKIIRAAARALSQSLDPCVLIPAFGAQKIFDIFEQSPDLLQEYNAMGYIGLIDYDEAYYKLRKNGEKWGFRVAVDLSSDRQQVWLRGTNEALMTIHRPEFRTLLASPPAERCVLEIEHLFTDENLQEFSKPAILAGDISYPKIINNKKKQEFAAHAKSLEATAFEEFKELFASISCVVDKISSQQR